MYFNRHIDKELNAWMVSKNRKPILLRGARQIGKTESVVELGKNFKNFLKIDFEETPEVHKIFTTDLSPKRICEELSLFYSVPIIEGETLLFFDEIQQCIPAIQSLRYFYEKMPNQHLIAAGSLLEFALENIASYGVGRIRSIFMYPMSFDEFLLAQNEDALLEKKRASSPSNPISEVLHLKLTQYFKKFLVIGGMPEVVRTYINTRDFNQCQLILDDLVYSFQDDFAKYKKSVPTSRLHEVFESVIQQTGQKFVFSKAALQSNHKQIKEALNLLIMAGLVIPVKHSAANGLPLGAESNPRKQKMMIFDTGIFQRILQLELNDVVLSDDFDTVNKGNIAELFVGLEMQKYQSPYHRNELFYWHREAKNSNAEVDFLLAQNGEIYPVEVKSGKKGSMRSMYIFLVEKKKEKGFRLSLENFNTYDKVEVYPLYAVSSLTNIETFTPN